MINLKDVEADEVYRSEGYYWFAIIESIEDEYIFIRFTDEPDKRYRYSKDSYDYDWEKTADVSDLIFLLIGIHKVNHIW